MNRSLRRSLRGSLSSNVWAGIAVLSVALLGCGGGGGNDNEGGSGGASGGKGGSAGKGGSGGAVATGRGGSSTGGSSVGGSSVGGSSVGGSSVGGSSVGGSSVGGSSVGGSSVGGSSVGGSSVGGSSVGGSSVGGSSVGGSSVGGSSVGGSSVGGSAAGAGGSAAGTGGAAPACVTDQPCALPGNVKGVCGNNSCTACSADSACQTAYDATYICVNADCVVGNCHQNSNCSGKICNTTSHLCESCTTGTAGDQACATAFGSGHICQNGTCITGTCHNNADCGTGGQICNAASQCVSCGSDDAACVASYGNGYICAGGSCVTGTCHTGAQCTGGKACNASHVCANCADDVECMASYGAGHICSSTNVCITGNCHTNAQCSNGQVCLGNSCADCANDGQCGSGQVCLPTGKCTTGNCHDATNCTSNLGVCLNNSCAVCTTDGQCVSGYGINHICEGGMCVAGNCRAVGDCQPTNQICNTGAKSCQNCATDVQCTTEYGPTHICLSGVCVAGNCHTTALNCSNGQLCNQATHLCGGCGTSDSACQADLPGTICEGNACISGNCHTAANCNDTTKICASNSCGMCSTTANCIAAYGTNHVCIGGACLSGNCQTSADCGGNQLCNTGTHLCEACGGATPAAADAKCTGDTVYGAMHICLAGQCVAGNCHDTSAECMNGQLCGIATAHTCGGCGNSDTACKSDTTYGNGTICLASGACVTGDCHDTSNDCPAGKLCGVAAAHTCGDCSGTASAADLQCTSDSRYGAGKICFQGNCQLGSCHANSQDCTGVNAGLICGNGGSPTVCGACSNDSECKADPFYGSAFICSTASGPNSGKCVTASCGTPATGNNNSACTANGGDFCCSSTCTAGNCCTNTDCVNNPLFGSGFACTNHTCTKCDGISSNTYYVDPINGSDSGSTGSGKSSGANNAACSFKTIGRAMQVIGTVAGPGTRVVIVGSGTPPTGLAAGDSLPITVQPNVIVTTTGGAVTITLPAATSQTNPANTSGFILSNSGSGLAGDALAPLIIDGNGNTSGVAVAVSGATTIASLANLTIQNTRAHAITVTAGTLNIGAGVTVKNAGTTGIARDNLAVSGGVANIAVPANTATTSFTGATQFGINVTALGSVNVTGVPVTVTAPSGMQVPNGNGTVVVSGNHGTAGLQIRQTAGGVLATNNINGLVTWTNDTDGARLSAGSKIKIRNSVFGANTVDGIRIVQGTGGTTPQQRDVSAIDLGTVGDFGHNYLQLPVGVGGRNQTAGLCVNIGGAATGSLAAAGNVMTYGTGSGTQVDCSTTAQTVTKGPTCTGGASLGIGGTTTVTVSLNMCN